MSKYFMVWVMAIFFLLSSISIAQEKKTTEKRQSKKTKVSTVWKSYGEKITLDKALGIKDIDPKKEYSKDKDILVAGTISDVCQNKGCWMMISEGGSSIRVEFKDYGFFVPWSSEGKRVKVQGRMKEKSLSPEAAEHMASEMKHPPTEKTDMKGQQVIPVVVASGVTIEGGGEITNEQQEIIDGKKEREGHQKEHGKN